MSRTEPALRLSSGQLASDFPRERSAQASRAPDPAVVVWAREEAANECAHALERRFPGDDATPLAVSQRWGRNGRRIARPIALVHFGSWPRPTTRPYLPLRATRGRARGTRRDEVRRHVGRRPGADQGGRAPARGRARARASASSPCSRRWASRPTTSSRSPHEMSPAPDAARAGHAHLGRRAHLLRARGDGDPRPRARGDLADRLAGRASSPTRRTARRRSSRCARSGSTRRSTQAEIVLVAGFQGVSTDLDVTTLGRGGSDTTAVALAAALGAERLRDLHRRRRRLHRRSAHRPRGAQAPRGQLRGDARDGGVRR